MARKKTISDAELLEIARSVFVEAGFGASSKEIARRAGVSEGVLFQRFSTKEELFFAAMTPPVADVSRMLNHPGATGQRLLEKITFAMLEYFRLLMPVLIPVMTHPSFVFEEFARRQPDSALVVLRRQLMEFMIREQRAARIGPVDPGAAALVVWSTAQTIAFFERLGAHDGAMGDAIVRAAVECLWKGMKPERGVPRAKRTP
ncbi:MAG TPA: TetR/AcrR family transcriptional regulator [Bryobacteraceae bacterium]|nr:TetR/AcrR family transcriptional regulator [Bryobacteraceae bacterium]